MNDLKGKKILYIGLGFYDYDDVIVKELEKQGAEVDFYLEKPLLNTLYMKIKHRIDRKLSYIKKHQQNILDRSKSKQYDIVFVIKGESLSVEFITQLKTQQAQTKFVMYQWDSLNRVANSADLIPFFDQVFSFDRIDCINYPNLIFRPLFFRQSKRENSKKYEFDLVFIGWLHADRLEVIHKVKAACEELGRKTYFFLFTGIKTYLQMFLRNQTKDLYVKSLPYSKVEYLHSNTKAVLDLPHPLQNGLTMRTIEAIGANTKLITSNKDIKNYDFYNENNIFIIDKENIEIQSSFFDREYTKIPEEIKNKYSLESWVEDIFCHSNSSFQG